MIPNFDTKSYHGMTWMSSLSSSQSPKGLPRLGHWIPFGGSSSQIQVHFGQGARNVHLTGCGIPHFTGKPQGNQCWEPGGLPNVSGVTQNGSSTKQTGSDHLKQRNWKEMNSHWRLILAFGVNCIHRHLRREARNDLCVQRNHLFYRGLPILLPKKVQPQTQRTSQINIFLSGVPRCAVWFFNFRCPLNSGFSTFT